MHGRYHELQRQPSKDRGKLFCEILRHDVKHLKPERLVVVEPGDLRVRKQFEAVADELSIELEETLVQFTTPYWEFMDRHFDLLKGNQRIKFPISNLAKMREK